MDRVWQRIERIAGTQPFAEVEAQIELIPGLSYAQRSALWLLAWSSLSAADRRAVAREAYTASRRPQG
jgi:hypothetical protein